MYRGGGSIGISATARSILLVAGDQDPTKQRRVLAVTGVNLAAVPTSLAYHLETADGHGCARLVWEGTSEHTSDSLLAVPMNNSDPSAEDEACSFLEDLLPSGSVVADEVKEAALAAGIAERTLQRAKIRQGIESVKHGSGKWYWHWPIPPSNPEEADHPPTDGHLGHLPHDQGKLIEEAGQILEGGHAYGLDRFGEPSPPAEYFYDDDYPDVEDGGE